MAQQLTRETRIDATPAQIAHWLSDWGNIHAWMGPTLVSIDMLSDHPDGTPICQGMRFRETRRMGKMTAKAEVEVLEHTIEDGTLHHVAVFDDGCNRMLSEYTYTPDGDGCAAAWTMRNAPNKWWTKMLKPVFGPMMVKMCEKHEGDHLDRLKELVERGGSPGEGQVEG
jgi:hypothetical protein